MNHIPDHPSEKSGRLAVHLLHVWPQKTGALLARLACHPAARLVPLLLLGLLLVACEEGGAIPEGICSAYRNSMFTLRLMGGAALMLGLAFLGFKKQISTVIPSQGAQTGAVVSSIAIGVLLLALSTEIGGQALSTFGLPNIADQC
jgi:hypothetical protein